MNKIDSVRTDIFHQNMKFGHVTFLVLAGFFLSWGFSENSIIKKIEKLTPTLTHAQSNEVLWVLRDCDERADSRHEDRVMQAQEKRNMERDLIRNNDFYLNLAIDLLSIRLDIADDIPEGFLEYYFDYRSKEADSTYDYEITSSMQTLNKDKFECEVAAKNLEEELRYVDEAERQIHFNFGSGSDQLNFLNISDFPKTKVTVQHIR